MTTERESEFRDAPAYQALQRSVDAIEKLRAEHEESLEGAPDDLRERFSRTESVVQNVYLRLSAALGEFATSQIVSQINSPAQNLAQALENFAEDGNPEYIRNVDGHLDTLLTAAAPLPPEPATGGRAGSLTRAARQSETRLTELSARADELAEEVRHLRESATNLTGEQRTALQDQRAEFSGRFESLFSDMEGKNQQAAEMLNLVASRSLGEEYIRERQREEWLGWFWTFVGFAALLVLLGVAAFAFITFDEDESLSLELVANRFLRQSALLAVLAAIATVSLRRAAYHRTLGEIARRIANELTLLPPFLDRLPDDRKETLLSVIAPRYFQGPPGGPAHTNDAETLLEMAARSTRGPAGAESTAEGVDQ